MASTVTTQDRRWLAAIYVLGTIAALIFVLLKSTVFMSTLSDAAHVNGDLYDFARVARFRLSLPAWVPPAAELRAESIADAELIAVGDSFLRTAHGAEAVVDQMARALGSRVYSAPFDGDPACVLRGTFAPPGKRRILLLECAEHFVLPRFASAWNRHSHRERSDSRWLEVARDLRRRWFVASERNYQYFVRNWTLTRPFYNAWAETRFACFAEISTKTPAFAFAPEPVLFYEQELKGPTGSAIRGFYQPRTAEHITAVAMNLCALAAELRAEYDVELVFMPVPSKYSVYYDLVDPGAKYDQFLPRLCTELERLGIPCVDMYAAFRAESELVYWPSDTHWNPRGAALACESFVVRLAALGWFKQTSPASPAARAELRQNP